SKYVFGGIGESAELAVDAGKAILDAHKRVEAWFEPPRAVRRSQAQFATRSRVERRPIRNVGASRHHVRIYREVGAVASRRAGWAPRAQHMSMFLRITDCSADYPTSEQLLFCSSIWLGGLSGTITPTRGCCTCRQPQMHRAGAIAGLADPAGDHGRSVRRRRSGRHG